MTNIAITIVPTSDCMVISQLSPAGFFITRALRSGCGSSCALSPTGAGLKRSAPCRISGALAGAAALACVAFSVTRGSSLISNFFARALQVFQRLARGPLLRALFARTFCASHIFGFAGVVAGVQLQLHSKSFAVIGTGLVGKIISR